MSAVKRVKFVSDRMSYIMLRGHLCHIVNVHAPAEDKIDYVKDIFYEELENVFNKFPKYHMKWLRIGTGGGLSLYTQQDANH
jgi:hypothetical protein